MSVDVLKKELQYFEKIKADLLKTNQGEFALIKDETLAGTFTTFEEAYGAGVEKFQDSPFLVKQVLEQESPENLPALVHSLLHASF